MIIPEIILQKRYKLLHNLYSWLIYHSISRIEKNKMNQLKLAIPNKGRLSEDVFDLLQRAGLSIAKRDLRSLYTHVT